MNMLYIKITHCYSAVLLDVNGKKKKKILVLLYDQYALWLITQYLI